MEYLFTLFIIRKTPIEIVHMEYTFNDTIEGYFSIYNTNSLKNTDNKQSLTTYNILLNFGAPLTIRLDLEEYEITSDQICFINPGSFVKIVASSDDAHYFISFNQAFYCLELHDKELSCNGLLFGAMPTPPILSAKQTEAKENQDLINMLLKEFAQSDSNQGDMLRLLLKRLIIICVRMAREQLFLSSTPPIEETDLVRKFQALVEKYFRDKHKVSDYAEMMYKSPKTLSNIFKKLNGTGPLRIIQERIILEAKRQMYYTDKTIKEITFELGFDEPAHFSRLFKKITGKSPSQFQFEFAPGESSE